MSACVEVPLDAGDSPRDGGKYPASSCAVEKERRSAVSVASPAMAVLTWNVEWLGDPAEGPTDDDLQYEAVRDVLRSEQAELLALQELASESAFARLLEDLPSRAGVLSGYDAPQKTALLWDAARFELRSARPVSGLDDAGRPPLEVVLEDRSLDAALRVVVIHAKAQADVESRARRERLSHALHMHLEAHEAPARRLVLGDFNDLLVGSIVPGAETPFRAFTTDVRYTALTRPLNEARAREGSYAFGGTVDHVIASASGGAEVEATGLNVLRDELLARFPSYAEQVSDHFPVTVTLLWP